MLILETTRSELLKPLQTISGIIERRHTMPILSNVLIENKS
ncbi:MAG: DNA polymerase III subunit beta, partial [Neisseriaceae bacterium]|nr:DNA polymerase III subunit beta [Neisseriaceae bacterium]